MNKELLEKLSECVEFGKINQASPYPPQMKGQPGADEITREALESGIDPSEILNDALVFAMNKVGQKYSENKIFVPQMLLSAKAMSASMAHLKPFFASGAVKRKGTFIIGTVFGDLHDIGKNLVAMMVEGSGWSVIDLGVDVSAEKYIQAIRENPGAVVAMSALLTTTMANMGNMINEIKAASPETKIFIGGAPVNNSFCQKIGADFYSPDPQGIVEYLNKQAS